MDNYIIAAGPEKADGPRKVSILLYSMGTRYRKIFASFTFAEDNDRKDYDKVTKKFDEYFEPKKLYMKKFNACVQKPTETVSKYTANLRDIAQHCDFGTTLNNQLCKQISCGVHSRVLRDKLWEKI